LHGDFDSGNLGRFVTYQIGQPGRQLPEFRGYRAVVGMNDQSFGTQIGHAGAAGKGRGQRRGYDSL
jgi:hypothetical protein